MQSGLVCLSGKAFLHRWHGRGDLSSVLLNGSRWQSFLSSHKTLFPLLLKLTHKVFSAIPGPPARSRFESWIHRSVRTDPSLRPCQTAVSTYTRFPQMATSPSVWAGHPRSRGQATETEDWEELSKHLLRSSWPLRCLPLWELFCSLIFLRLCPDREKNYQIWGIPGAPSTALHILIENAFSYETLHVTFLRLEPWFCLWSQRWRLSFYRIIYLWKWGVWSVTNSPWGSTPTAYQAVQYLAVVRERVGPNKEMKASGAGKTAEDSKPA